MYKIRSLFKPQTNYISLQNNNVPVLDQEDKIKLLTLLRLQYKFTVYSCCLPALPTNAHTQPKETFNSVSPHMANANILNLPTKNVCFVRVWLVRAADTCEAAVLFHFILSVCLPLSSSSSVVVGIFPSCQWSSITLGLPAEPAV